MLRNGIEPCMNKLPAGTVEVCNKVLEMNPRTIGKRENEYHFCPPQQYREQREGIVTTLIVEKKITTVDYTFRCSVGL